MADVFGLRIWDSVGQLIFDTTTRTGRAFGSHALAAAQSVTLPIDVTPGKTPWVMVYASGGILADYSYPAPGHVRFDTGPGNGSAVFFYGER